MFRRRRQLLVLAALLVLVHAFAPFAHALAHGIHGVHGAHGTHGGHACAALRDASVRQALAGGAGVEGDAARLVAADAAHDEACGLCELLGGDRSLDGPQPLAKARVEPLLVDVVGEVPAAPCAQPRRRAPGARAPPHLQV